MEYSIVDRKFENLYQKLRWRFSGDLSGEAIYKDSTYLQKKKPLFLLLFI